MVTTRPGLLLRRIGAFSGCGRQRLRAWWS